MYIHSGLWLQVKMIDHLKQRAFTGFGALMLFINILVNMCLILNLCGILSSTNTHKITFIVRSLIHSDSRSTSAVMRTTWLCTSTLVSTTILMELLLCATQRLLVAGTTRKGKYTTPYTGAQMSRWGDCKKWCLVKGDWLHFERIQVLVFPKPCR